MSDSRHEAIRSYYHALSQAWGSQHWWPAQSRFEMIVGAYLTQNTAWTNVEKALASLRRARLLSLDGMRRAPVAKLARHIRSAGYFRQKAHRLKVFVKFLDTTYGGSLTRMFARPTAALREELLALHGVGPETADSILLYAGNHPIFVVDAYTRRILERHEIVTTHATYDEIRQLFEQVLAPVPESHFPAGDSREAPGAPGSSHHPSRMSTAARTPQVQILNEMHGLLVGVGKNFCLKSQSRCEQCPLQKFLPRAK